MTTDMKSVVLGARRWLRRFWEDLVNRRTDLMPSAGDKATELTVSGFVTLLTGAATQLGALSDWADRVFLGFGGGWALVSKLAAHLLAIGLAYRVITKTTVVDSGSTYSIPQHSYFSSGRNVWSPRLFLLLCCFLVSPPSFIRSL
jgi:hypothetical protein